MRTATVTVLSTTPPLAQGKSSGEPQSYALSQFFQGISEHLQATASRPDGGHHNLRNAAFSALMALVRSAPQDCYGEVQRVTYFVLERLQSVNGLETQIVSSQDRAQFNDLQSLLCGTLQSVLRKINKEDAKLISNRVRSSPRVCDELAGCSAHL